MANIFRMPIDMAKAVLTAKSRWVRFGVPAFIALAVVGAIVGPDNQQPPPAPATMEAGTPPPVKAPRRKPSDSDTSGDEIIANAPPNTTEEEAAGLRAFCDQARNTDLKSAAHDAAAMLKFILRADQEVVDRTGESLERANIVVTRVARAFGEQIYGPWDCASALRD